MKLCIQTESLVHDLGYEAAYRTIREAGFEAVDWNLNTAWSFKQVVAAE